MALRGGAENDGRGAIASMTGERLRETLGSQVRELLKVVGNFETKVRRFTATTEVTSHGTPTIHTRSPATPVGIVSIGDHLIAAFHVEGEESPEVADLLRVYAPEGRSLRLAKNPLAHHKGLSRWISDLYLSHRGRVRFAEVMEEPGQVILAFEVQHGAGRGARRHLLGLDITQGIEDVKLLRHPMPKAPIQPDFKGFKELDEAPWLPGEPTNSYYHHMEIGPLYVFLEWGALKIRDYLDLPRGTADLVIEAAADPDHSVSPDSVEMLPSDQPDREVFCRVTPEEGRPSHYIYYSKRPRRMKRVDVSGIPGLKLPGRAGKISSMFLWSGGEMRFLGGLPAEPVGIIEASGVPDRLFVFQAEDGPITLHHFEGNKRKVLHSFSNLRDYTLTRSGHLYIWPKGHDEEEIPALEHTLGWYITPFKDEDGDFSAKEQAYLRSFKPDEVEGLAEAARALQAPLEDEDYRVARDRLDTLLIAFPFVERAADIRGAIQELFDSLSKVTAIEEELSEIHDRRREAFADFEEEAKAITDVISVDARRPVASVVEDITTLRGLLGRMETLGQASNQPPDTREALKAMGRRLKALIRRLSEAGATSAKAAIEAIDSATAEALEEVQEQDSLIAIEERMQKARGDRDALRAIVDTLTLLEVDTQESLAIAQAGTAAVVKTDRLESALKTQSQGLSKSERESSFQAYSIQLDLRIATEPGACRTVEDCDGRLDALIAEIEVQKGTYADFPDLIESLDKRIVAAQRRFEARKLTLVKEREEAKEELSRLFTLRLSALSVAARGADLDPQALEGFLATHPEAQRCQEVLEKLRALGLDGQASRLAGQLDQARRVLISERQERSIFSIDGETLTLGGTRFVRNRLALGVQERYTDTGLLFQISGTRMQIPGEQLGLIAPEGFQGDLNETEDISRGEYLAFRILWDGERSGALDDIVAEAKLKKDDALPLLEARCRARILSLPGEEHTLGLHDKDAAEILRRVAPTWVKLGVLSYPPSLRVDAAMMWQALPDPDTLAKQLEGMMALGRRLGSGQQGPRRALKAALSKAGAEPTEAHLAYLLGEIDSGGLREGGSITHHPTAIAIAQGVLRVTGEGGLDAALGGLSQAERLDYLLPEVEALIEGGRLDLEEGLDDALGEGGLPREAAYILAQGAGAELGDGKEIKTRLTIRGLGAEHPRNRGALVIDLPLWYGRLSHFHQTVAPGFSTFTDDVAKARRRLAEDLELKSLIPKPLARFAWTGLLQRVYLPLVAQALQKQLGSIDTPGSDQMGLLLLVSPPGYGKTELLKKVASLLGYGFVTISGTALGNDTHSLDPDAAPNKAAGAALDRLLRGLELGDNLIVDIEDVHACSEAFLEKLLPLCDATRSVEVARGGELKQVSLQGQRVAVVMTLNPLRANIPPALASRATLLNLGDVADRYGEDFALSYLEVAAPANQTLERVSANRDLVTLAKALGDGRDWASLDRDLNGQYAKSELRRIRGVLEHAVAIRDVMVAVNRACLKSATVQDAYRDTPAFELQGSYRDMVEITRRIEPDWTDEDRRVAILNHYEGQAGLLASQGEANLLTLKAMLGQLGEDEGARLEHIRHVFKLNQEREQTLLTLLDRLTEVSEAVQRVPAAVNAHGEQLAEHLSHAFAGASHTLMSLPQAAASADRRLKDPMERAVLRAIESLGKAILQGQISTSAHMADTLEQGFRYLFGGGGAQISPPKIPEYGGFEPEPIFDAPEVELPKPMAPWKEAPQSAVPQSRDESQFEDESSSEDEAQTQPEDEARSQSEDEARSRSEDEAQSQSEDGSQPEEDTSEDDSDPLDLVEAYADADPDTFIARLLEAESKQAAAARTAPLLEIARPEGAAPEEPPIDAPPQAHPTPGDIALHPEGPETLDKALLGVELPEMEADLDSPAAPAPAPLQAAEPDAAPAPTPEADIQPETGATPPPTPRAQRTPPSNPGGGALAAAMGEALRAAQVRVVVDHGAAPPWSKEIKESLDGVRSDLARLAELGEKRPKTDIVSTLRSFLKALPEE